MPEPKHPTPERLPDPDAELDEALEETFPASDPIAPMQHRPSEEAPLMIKAKLAAPAYRVDIDAAGHALVGDEGAAHGGADAGASPFDLVLSGLAACTLITLRMYAERKSWTGFTASAELRHRLENGRHLVDRHVHVAGVPDEAGFERLRDIVERTPVTLALKSGFEIATTLNPATESVR